MRELTPATSVGFDQIEFARDVLHRPLDPWQEFAAIHGGELLPDGRPRFRILIILVARQNGKALDVSTPVLTVAGWSTVGALRVGDEVFHPDGKPVRITAAHSVMLDHDCYRVMTTDGRTVIADAGHLWTVQDRRKSTRKGRRGEKPIVSFEWETLTTEQLALRGLMRGPRDFAFRLPRQHAIVSPDVALPVDPYVLGAWLGDGNSTSSALTIGDQDLDETIALMQAAGLRIVSKVREHTAWRVGFSMDERRRRVCAFRSAAVELGVWGNKHVPDLYLTAGTEQRLALLQGLLDTDGSISKAGQVEFSASRRDLADGMLYLARSLGWRATIREDAAMLNGREVGRRYRVTFSPAVGEPVPFRLRRKAVRVPVRNGRVPVRNGRGGERQAVSIRSIERVESRPVRCIRVDREDGMFLAGSGLMATHNTELLVILTLYWQFIDAVPLILGTSTKLDYAKESWRKAVTLAERCADSDMAALRPRPRWYREANGEQESWTTEGSRYKIAASNPEGGRSLTIDRLILDELRQHRDYSAWDAAEPAASPSTAQIWALSNAGDDSSIVLNELRDEALRYIETGEGDYRLGLLEWSAPEDADPCDVHALAMANPNLGRRGTDADTLLAAAQRAVRKGGAALTGFKTEKMCINVPHANPAIDPGAWRRGFVPGDLSGARSRVALCFDVAPDLMHATLAAAAVLPDDRARLEVVAAWEGPKCLDRMRGDLPALLARVRPQVLGWLPSGPAAAFAADLAARPGWPPKGVTVTEIRGEVAAVCMGFAEQVRADRVLHCDDPLLNAHVGSAEQLRRPSDTWVFSRRGAGHVDAAYAGAGAVHLARTLPPPVGRPRLVVAP